MEALRYPGRWLALAWGLGLYSSLACGAEPAYFTALYLEHLSKPVELPEFNMVDVDDKSVSLHSLRGRVILLNFWTTW